MAILLEEYDDIFSNQPDLSTTVQIRDDKGKLIKNTRLVDQLP